VQKLIKKNKLAGPAHLHDHAPQLTHAACCILIKNYFVLPPLRPFSPHDQCQRIADDILSAVYVYVYVTCTLSVGMSGIVNYMPDDRRSHAASV